MDDHVTFGSRIGLFPLPKETKNRPVSSLYLSIGLCFLFGVEKEEGVVDDSHTATLLCHPLC